MAHGVGADGVAVAVGGDGDGAAVAVGDGVVVVVGAVVAAVAGAGTSNKRFDNHCCVVLWPSRRSCTSVWLGNQAEVPFFSCGLFQRFGRAYEQGCCALCPTENVF